MIIERDLTMCHVKVKYETYPFPFDRVQPHGCHIVLWGYGSVGKSYYEQIRSIEYCFVDAIIDESAGRAEDTIVPEHLLECVASLESIDYFIIAVYDIESVKLIENYLLRYGISKSKIVKGVKRELNYISFELKNIDTIFFSILHKYLKIYRVLDKRLIRIGGENDGGYIMIDDFPGGVAYSFGISNDVEWDSAMADRGYEIFMYDHTVNELPYHRKEFHFFSKGIIGISPTSCLDTLESFVKMNHHTKQENMILKMDVEGFEWNVINTVDSNLLEQFDQIVIEMHGIFTRNRDEILAGIYKLNLTHNVVHIHANNYSQLELQKGNCNLSDVLEVTWVSKRKYKFGEMNGELPLQIDSPCDTSMPEVIIGKWNSEF